MTVDYPGAIPMFVAENRTFIDNNTHDYLVIHKTASGGSAQNIATFFANDPAMASTHYVVGQDGTVVQCVLEKDGAAGNCCLFPGHAPYLPTGVNLNTRTVSIEHVDPASDNSTPLTDAQKKASFPLIKSICQRHNIPMRAGDAAGGIIGHHDIDPVNRARCPGNFPWDELFTYLQGGTSMTTTASGLPGGAKDNGKDTITFSNGCVMKLGFRAKYLEMAQAGLIPSDDMALENEHGSSPVEESNPTFWGGGGTAQVTRYFRLGYSPKAGVNVTYIGQELMWYMKALASPPVAPSLPPLPAGLSPEQKAAVTQLESSLAQIEAALKILGG